MNVNACVVSAVEGCGLLVYNSVYTSLVSVWSSIGLQLSSL